MKKTAFWIMMITILSQITGFLRDTTLSSVYGAANVSDAYLIAIGIPMTLFTSLGHGIGTSFIPIYSRVLKENGREAGDIYTNRAISLMLVLCTGLIALGWIFAPQLIFVFASGFPQATADLAVRFLRISILTIYIMMLTYIWKGYLQVRNRFITTSFMGIPMNFLIILSIVFSIKWGLWMLVIGYVIAYSSQAIVLLPAIYREGWRFQFDLKWKDPAINKMIWMMVPMAFGASMGQLNVVVDRTVASLVMEGGISLLTYASRLTGVVQFAFGMTIITIVFPAYAKYVAENRNQELKISLRNGLNNMSLLTVPAMVGLLVLAQPIVQLFFERGAFTSESTIIAGQALFMYAIGVWGNGITELISRVFYAYHDTRTPVLNTTLSLGLNIVLNLLLSRWMGLRGIALATSLSAIFCTVILLILLYKKIGPFLDDRIFWVSNIKIVLSATITGVGIRWIYIHLTKIVSSNMATLTSIFAGIMIYGILILILRVKEVEFVWGRLRSRKIKSI